jgi:maltoporin
MRSWAWGILGVALAASAGRAADPGSSADVQGLREELQQIKADYERRIADLERRIAELQKSPAAPTGDWNADASLAGEAVRRQVVRAEFAADTEDRGRDRLLAEETPLAGRINLVLEDFLDTRGSYFRAGYGIDDGGGIQRPFQAPGALAKYRLGNETEQYSELVLARTWFSPRAFGSDQAVKPGTGLYSLSDGPVVHGQLRLSVFADYENPDADFNLPEAWVSIGNVLDGNPSTKFWAGSRFYRRHDIHISDFYFLNMSGLGGGVEDVDLGFAKAAAAWIGDSSADGTYATFYPPNPDNPSSFAKRSVDLRLYDVQTGPGKSEFVVTYARAEGGKYGRQQVEDSDGAAVMWLHTTDGVLGPDGQNKASLQVGYGPAKTFTAGFEKIATAGGVVLIPDDPDSWRVRATDHFTVQPTDWLSIQPAVVYQYTDYENLGGEQSWYSVGARPVLHFNRHTSLAFEAGMDYVDDSARGQSDYLAKLTLAPQVAIGGRFFSRPVIRAYVTYAFWGDDFMGAVGGDDYREESSGWAWGLQTEAWW